MEIEIGKSYSFEELVKGIAAGKHFIIISVSDRVFGDCVNTVVYYNSFIEMSRFLLDEIIETAKYRASDNKVDLSKNQFCLKNYDSDHACETIYKTSSLVKEEMKLLIDEVTKCLSGIDTKDSKKMLSSIQEQLKLFKIF